MSSLFIQLAFAGFFKKNTDQLAASRGIVTLISAFTSTGSFELEKHPMYDPSVIGGKLIQSTSKYSSLKHMDTELNQKYFDFIQMK